MPSEHDLLAAQLAAAAALEPPYPEGRFADHGIVICAGGARMFTCAWVAIGILRRHLGCTLPIEVWYIGSDEMGPPMRALLEELGAQPVDALEVAGLHGVGRLGGWELKTYALLHSRFRQVLLLDADNVPLRDPSFLFERAEFGESGALFWPDTLHLSRSNPIWIITGLAPYAGPTFESGQLVLDKSRCWRPLSLAHWLNQQSPILYDLIHGDKDTFLLAWLLLDQPFYLIPHALKLLECTLCQRDPDGAILFQHRNGAKWILQGVNPRIEGFRLERECLQLLDELAHRWDGRVFNPPPRSQEARKLERELAGRRDFRFVRLSSDDRHIELLPGHGIGAGAGGREMYWYVADGEDGCELVLEAGNRRSCALRRSEDGIWRGRLLYEPETPVELAPTASAEAHRPRPEHPIESLAPLLDRALAAYAVLPQDAEVMRDFAGFIRTLATLEPSLTRRLSSELERRSGSETRARLIRLALDGLAAPDAEARAPGHNWNTYHYPRAGYEYLA